MGIPFFSGRTAFGGKTVSGALAAGLAVGAFLTVASSHTLAHDEHERVTEERDVSGFTRIEIKGAIELELTAGEDFSVTITAEDYPIADVTTEVDGDKLIIDMEEQDRFMGWDDADVDVRITMPTLRELEVTGAVDGEFDNIDSEELMIDIRGAADVEFEGTCGTLTLDVRGAGDIDADKLRCKDVEVDVKGAGSASVFASESVDARVAGVASISIYGDPKNVRKHEGGLSSISIK